jgi:hypothetical protein
MAGKPMFLCYFLFTGNPNLAVTPVFSPRRTFRALSALKYPQKTFFGSVPSTASILVRCRCAPVWLGFVYIPSPSSSRKAPPENELPLGWARSLRLRSRKRRARHLFSVPLVRCRCNRPHPASPTGCRCTRSRLAPPAFAPLPEPPPLLSNPHRQPYT